MRKNRFIDISKEEIRNKSLDGILVSKIENVRYLTGFSGSTGYVWFDGTEAIFLTDFRYIEQAEIECSGWRIEVLSDGLKKWFKDRRVKRIGLEESATLAICESFREEGMDVVKIDRIVENLRVIKEKDEVELIKKALEIAEQAFNEVLPFIKEGVTEKDLEAELVHRIKKLGAEREAFNIIVASGRRSSLPHGVASSKRIEMNDVIVFDFGAVYKGYHSDITRVVVLGNIKREVMNVHKAIVSAMDTLIENLRENVECKDLHGLAVGVLAKFGYDRYFGHGTGHGVGLEIHEAPTVSSYSKDRLKSGMVFTVEPGVYFQGTFGLRIEDIVYFDREPFVLTRIPRDIILI